MEPRSGAAGRAPAGQRGQVADPGVPRNSDPRRSEAHDGTALPRRLGRAMLVGSVLLSAVSIATIMLLLPGGTPVSSDPGAPSLPNWVILLPPAGGILLTLVLPWRAGPMPVVPVRLSRLLLTTTGLLVLLAVFSLVTGLVPLRGEDYVLGKFVLLMLIPGVLLLLVRDAVKIATRSGWWRWWAPLLVIAAWFYLSQVAPWNARYDPGDIDPVYLIIAALATAITAGVGEELFFRRWLQTRLEAILGAWAGIGVTSVLFGLMHLGSHGTGEVLVDIARVIAIQGTFGWFLGVLWWRYRNLTLIIGAHLLSNGWGVITYLIAQR